MRKLPSYAGKMHMGTETICLLGYPCYMHLPVGTNTSLSRISELASDGAPDGHLYVSRVEDDEGGVASQLQGNALDGLAALGH